MFIDDIYTKDTLKVNNFLVVLDKEQSILLAYDIDYNGVIDDYSEGILREVNPQIAQAITDRFGINLSAYGVTVIEEVILEVPIDV
jgi:hypothetical protein